MVSLGFRKPEWMKNHQIETMTFFWCKFGFGKCFRASSRSNHWADLLQLLYKTHFFSCTSKSRRCHFKITYFKIFGQLTRHPLIEPFHLSNLLQMPNDCRMVNVEFFGNFSCIYKKISFDYFSQLVIVKLWCLATALLIFKSLISFAELLEPALHCTFISSSWAKCVVDVASCLHSFTTHFQLE